MRDQIRSGSADSTIKADVILNRIGITTQFDRPQDISSEFDSAQRQRPLAPVRGSVKTDLFGKDRSRERSESDQTGEMSQ
jgi:hypothetical protein